MKKTLVALTVAAFASSASALTIYEQDGSKVEFDGSVRLRLDNESTKQGDVTTKRGHSNLHNDGSRFGVRMKHAIADDFYALGRLEFRFDDEAEGTDKFGDLYAKRAYIGLGSSQFGELTFGRQLTIGDDIAQAGFDYAYGTFDGTLTSSGTSVVRYDYKGVEGLQVGVDYRFAEKRDANGEVAAAKDLKSGYGAGVTYGFAVTEGQKLTLATGYTRDNFKTLSNHKHHKDAWQVGAKYSVEALTLAADYAGAFDKEDSSKKVTNWFRVGAKYQVTSDVGVYSNYGHGVVKDKNGSVTTSKTTYDRFMLGTDYKLHKNVVTYLEGSIAKAKVDGSSSTKNRNIGVGLRVSW